MGNSWLVTGCGWFCAGVGKPGGPYRISLAVWNVHGLTWGSWETKAALLLLCWAVLALAKFPRGASSEEQGFSQAHCNAFRPKLD